jgi:serine/threonine-protein kinase
MTVAPSSNGTAARSEAEVGQLVAGKYRVERTIGRGGSSVVLEAVHVELGQRVALKVLSTSGDSPRAYEQMLREARAAARLVSEHAARVFDVGTLPNGKPFIVMDYLVGSDLGSHLRSEGALPTPVAADFVVQACEALAEAHAAGIVHRDLKPRNLFLTRRADGSPSVKVLDFGLSISVAEAQSIPTGFAGTPGYAAPEQIHVASDVDARADIWALGVILYQLTSGKLPFGGENPSQMLLNVLRDEPPRLTGFDGASVLWPIVARCLAKDRDHRYATVAELAEDLGPIAGPDSANSVRRIGSLLATSTSPTNESEDRPSLATITEGATLQDATGSNPDWSVGADATRSHARHSDAKQLLTAEIIPPRRSNGPAGIVMAAFLIGALLWFIVPRDRPHASGEPAPTVSTEAASQPPASAAVVASTAAVALPRSAAPPPQDSAPQPRATPSAEPSAATAARHPPTRRADPPPARAEPKAGGNPLTYR